MTEYVLFVCAQNVCRSRAAEVLRLLGGVDARSCGTDDAATVLVNDALLLKATEVVCREQTQAKFVREFMGAEGKEVSSLGIPDEFDPFAADLVEVLMAVMKSRNPAVAAAIERGAAVMNKQGFVFT